eukprot:2123205-Rhodomonas_salina.1
MSRAVKVLVIRMNFGILGWMPSPPASPPDSPQLILRLRFPAYHAVSSNRKKTLPKGSTEPKIACYYQEFVSVQAVTVSEPQQHATRRDHDSVAFITDQESRQTLPSRYLPGVQCTRVPGWGAKLQLVSRPRKPTACYPV